MKILLDTNVLIAAFIAHGACAELLEYVIQHHTVVSSNYVLDELQEKLVTKFGVSKREAREAAGLLSERVHLVEPAPVLPAACSDKDDLPVLGTAVSGGCACIVTGDRDLLTLREFEGIPILSPSEFWKREAELARNVAGEE